MNLDGLFTSEKPFCDFPVSIALCDEPEDLDLALRQGFIAVVFGKAACDEGRYIFFPGVHSPDRIDELRWDMFFSKYVS